MQQDNAERKRFDRMNYLWQVCRVMSASRKSVQVRIYLSPEEQDALAEIKNRLQTQSEAWILSTLTGSALRGIAANGYRFPLPLKLGIQPENEPKVGKK